MTLAEHLEQRGVERGHKQGREQEKVAIAKNSLIEGVDPGFVVKITGLDLRTVLELQASLDKSSSVTDYEVLHKLLHGAVSSETEEKIMTLAEHFEQRGYEQGYEQGFEQAKMTIAKNLLIEGVEPEFIVKVMSLDLDEVIVLMANKSDPLSANKSDPPRPKKYYTDCFCFNR
ncbi:MAG: hypothetical protein V3V61_01170 [Gammaproteobacteria bacterium]